MDYLDPEKSRRHHQILLVGYVLIGMAILFGAYLLLNLTYGYARGKDGHIIQNGFVFVSSQPHPAQIYVDNQLHKSRTNTRLTLPAGHYTIQLKRDGYRDWQRGVTVEGGDVQHFDYPFLVPTTLTTTSLHTYPAAPGLATQSPDQRWLIVQPDSSPTNFDLYDLKNPSKAPTALGLPTSLLSKGRTQSWQLVEWSTDNKHVLLNHMHDGASEFIVLDRENPAQSVNLNRTYSANPSTVSLNDKKFDQYYLYDSTKHLLQAATLKSPGVTNYLDHVLAYKSYGNDTVLYASDQNAIPGKAAISMQVGSRNYKVREVAAGAVYLLDLTKYSGDLYVAVGSSAENKLYIYKDPVSQLTAKPSLLPAPVRALRLSGPNFVSFSNNAQFIMTEAGQAVAVYDIENSKSYNYALKAPLDTPQQHVSWMDGDRLVYVSQGTLELLDYDNTNAQSLMSMSAGFLPFFAPNYKHVFGLAGNTQAQVDLTQTALLTPADL